MGAEDNGLTLRGLAKKLEALEYKKQRDDELDTTYRRELAC
jgi:hypothetical protein